MTPVREKRGSSMLSPEKMYQTTKRRTESIQKYLDGVATAMPKKNQIVVESEDGRNKVREISSSKKRRLASTPDHPTLIVGFPGTGLVGSISINYIIESMAMHQIAAIDSEFVIPTVTYIGGMLRHPFRIYHDNKISMYALICEAPIRPEGAHSIMETVVRWMEEQEIGEVIVLDGIPVRGFPSKDREPIVLTSYGNKDGNGMSEAALMTGTSAALLSSCLSNNVACTAVLVQATIGVPDPEGAAVLLERISDMPNVPLEINTAPLIKKGKEIKRRLIEDIENLKMLEESDTKRSSYAGRSQIYG